MNKTIKWGILGCGNIAGKFAEGLQAVPDAVLSACAGRTAGKAEQFAKNFSITTHYTTYEELAVDPEIDIIYIATTHNFHYENALLCLNSGKNVLIEKAATTNSKEFQTLIDMANQKNLFLMEAMWTRFLPSTLKMLELIGQDEIGEVRRIQADFSIPLAFDPKARHFNPALAGGALLDLGIYPISFSQFFMKDYPEKITSTVHLGETGVDERGEYILEYNNSRSAILSSATRIHSPFNGVISGTKGYIRIPNFFMAKEFFLSRARGGEEEQFSVPFESTGYNYEAAECIRCIQEGLNESPMRPHKDTMDVMRIMDALRSQWKMKYPWEI